MKPLSIALLSLLSILAGCSPSTEPPASSAPQAAPPPTAEIQAPAGQYRLDPYHSSLSFRVSHLGLAPYVARFTKIDATLDLDPANQSASKVSVTVDPASVRTDFSGDYPATHKGTLYKTFDEALAQDPKFFNAGQFPQAGFRSTAVEVQGPGKLRITGELSLLGQTHPVTLDAVVAGSVAQHPWTKRGAIGFSATGTFKRSAFGMMALLQPVLVGDEVTVEFNGEFHQPAPEPAG